MKIKLREFKGTVVVSKRECEVAQMAHKLARAWRIQSPLDRIIIKHYKETAEGVLRDLKKQVRTEAGEGKEWKS